jgi:hypothetical protein
MSQNATHPHTALMFGKGKFSFVCCLKRMKEVHLSHRLVCAAHHLVSIVRTVSLPRYPYFHAAARYAQTICQLK